MNFEISNIDSKSQARCGVITTDNGKIETPIFMPVGTAGAVKAVYHRELKNDIQAEIILANTYHLYVRPGIELLKKAGGMHKFCGWNKPMLTDSGGYQVFSLSNTRKITEEGVFFKSHVDGSQIFFSPENVIDTQRIIGADIIMAFDECTPYPAEYGYAKQSMNLTHKWLKRCFNRFNDTSHLYAHKQALFPIVQGSTYKELRLQSAEEISSFGAEGNAIGGLSVGEPHEDMYDMLQCVCDVLPKDKPRYLMGVGTPENILECIALGVDMFDCVMPTRNARNGMLFTTEGIINIKNKKWQEDFTPIDAQLDTHVSNFYTKAYLRHLFVSKEILGAQIASVHNLSFYLWLVKEARKRILAGDFMRWKKNIQFKVSQKL